MRPLLRMEAIPERNKKWSFRILEGAKQLGSVAIDEWADKGTLKIHGSLYEVKLAGYEFYEQGVLKGTFHLEKNGQIIVRAIKETALQNYFLFELGDNNYYLEPSSIFRRHIQLIENNHRVAKVRPKNIFSKIARIEFQSDLPVESRMFVIWIALLMWKRSTLPVTMGNK